MIFLSQILGSAVYDSAHERVGKLHDLIARVQTGKPYPFIHALLVERHGKQEFIHYTDIENLSPREITLKAARSHIEHCKSAKDDLFLKRDVIDKQIIDVRGVKVVRANDVQLGKVDDAFGVLGIDVSTKGILRRLGFGWVDFFNVLKPKYLDWKDVNTMRGQLQVNVPFTNLKKLHPADIANILQDLNFKESERLVGSLDAVTGAKVIEELPPKLRRALLSIVGEERAASIVEKMSLDDIADLLRVLPKKEADALLAYFHDAEKLSKVEKLLPYEDDTAGGLMTPEYVAVEPQMTVAEVLHHLKKVTDQFRAVHFVYVLDTGRHLLGEITLRTLLVSPPHMKAEKIMKRRKVLKLDTPEGEIAKRMTKYNLMAMAVLDHEKRIVGIVTVDDIMRRLVPNA
ncbi:magnesium transporter [Candidatus Uhrbacteria bacterium]|nr:magnesium transporter [Candidatus Uhrbacteria bacterium]